MPFSTTRASKSAAPARSTLRRALAGQRGRRRWALDQAAIDTVRAKLWPDLRDEHELHDLLLSLVAAAVQIASTPTLPTLRHWPHFYERLQQPAACAPSISTEFPAGSPPSGWLGRARLR
jgi:hypothetical protein